jgi:aromatic ring hydroxylase-like protein
MRARMAALFNVEQRKVTELLGIEAGYCYVDSPIIWRDQGGGPDPNNPAYVPTAWPGARLPHVWLDDGTALHDRLGPGFTLLRLGGTHADTSCLEQLFQELRAPLNVLDEASERARELYEYDLLLVRPDLHVAWRGNELPADAARIAMASTAHLPYGV